MPIPAVTYVLSTAFAGGVSSAHVAYGSGGQTFDVLAALVAGGGNSKGVGGSFSVTDADIAAALDTYEVVARSGAAAPPPVTNPTIAPLVASQVSPATGDMLYRDTDGYFKNTTPDYQGDSAVASTSYDTTAHRPLVIISSRRAINPRDKKYGAIGDGNSAHAAADTAGLRAAYVDGFNTGRRVTPGDGIFYLNSNIGSNIGTGVGIALPFALEGEGFNKTIFRRTGDFRHLDILGNKGVSASVVGSIVAGDTTITIGSGLVAARGIAAGSVINLTSSKLWFAATDSVSYYGELLVVKSVAGDVITVQGYIEESYAAVDSPVVAKITPSRGVDVGGITFEGTNGVGVAGALLATYCRDIDIDVQGIGLDGPTVQTQDCFKGSVRVDSQDSSDDQPNGRFGYGWNCAGSSRDLEGFSSMCVGRHAFTTNGHANGVPRHIRCNVRGREMTNAAADTHEAGQNIHFPIVEAHDSYAGAAKLRAPNSTIGKLIGRRLDDSLLHVAGSATGGHVDEIFGRLVGRASPGNPGARVGADDFVIGSVDIDGVGAEGLLFRAARPRLVGGGRIANVGQVDATKKRCVATAASGSETGDSWTGASDVLMPQRLILENADYGVYEHAAGVVAEANIIARNLVNRTNRSSMELLRRIDEAGQGNIVLPRFGADVSGGQVPVANRAYAERYMPVRDFSLASIGWSVDAAGGAGDSCEVALLSAAQTVLAVSPATTGKLNTTGTQKIALTGGPFVLLAGVAYYLVFLATSVTGTLRLGWKTGGSGAGSMNPFGNTAGLMENGQQSSVTSVSGTGWNGSSSPSLGTAQGVPMLQPLET